MAKSCHSKFLVRLRTKGKFWKEKELFILSYCFVISEKIIDLLFYQLCWWCLSTLSYLKWRYRKNRIFKHTLIHTYKRKFFSFCLKLHRKPKGTSFLLVLKYFLKKENNKNFVFVSYLRFLRWVLRDCVELSRCMQVWDWISTDDFLYLTGHYIQNGWAVILPFWGRCNHKLGLNS